MQFDKETKIVNGMMPLMLNLPVFLAMVVLKSVTFPWN